MTDIPLHTVQQHVPGASFDQAAAVARAVTARVEAMPGGYAHTPAQILDRAMAARGTLPEIAAEEINEIAAAAADLDCIACPGGLKF